MFLKECQIAIKEAVRRYENNLAMNAKKNPVDVVYTEFAKAFDKVSYTKPVFKLKFYGFSERLINWISSFLTGRSQKVVLGQTKSE